MRRVFFRGTVGLASFGSIHGNWKQPDALLHALTAEAIAAHGKGDLATADRLLAEMESRFARGRVRRAQRLFALAAF